MKADPTAYENAVRERSCVEYSLAFARASGPFTVWRPILAASNMFVVALPTAQPAPAVIRQNAKQKHFSNSPHRPPAG